MSLLVNTFERLHRLNWYDAILLHTHIQVNFKERFFFFYQESSFYADVGTTTKRSHHLKRETTLQRIQ